MGRHRGCRPSIGSSPTSASAAPTRRRSAWPARGAPEGTLVWAARADRRARPARPRLGLAAGQSLSRRCCCGRAARRPRAASSASSPPRAGRGASSALLPAGAARDAANGRTTCWSTAPRSPASCSRRQPALDRSIDWLGHRHRRQRRQPSRRYALSRRPRSQREGGAGATAAAAARRLRRSASRRGTRAGAGRVSRRSAPRWLAARAAASASRSRSGCERETLQGRFVDLDESGALMLDLRGRRAAGRSPPATCSFRSFEDDRHAARHQRQQHQRQVRRLRRRDAARATGASAPNAARTADEYVVWLEPADGARRPRRWRTSTARSSPPSCRRRSSTCAALRAALQDRAAGRRRPRGRSRHRGPDRSRPARSAPTGSSTPSAAMPLFRRR